jgi:hypothetical protein
MGARRAWGEPLPPALGLIPHHLHDGRWFAVPDDIVGRQIILREMVRRLPLASSFGVRRARSPHPALALRKCSAWTSNSQRSARTKTGCCARTSTQCGHALLAGAPSRTFESPA